MSRVFDAYVGAFVPQAEKSVLQALAQRDNLTVSEKIRAMIAREAKRVLVDEAGPGDEAA
jgi:hypothetical protein